MRKNVLTGFVALLFSSLFWLGCYNDNSEDLFPQPTQCDTSNVTFTATIQPILNQHCALANCHATGSALGGYMLDNYDGVKNTVMSGRIIGAINWEAGYSQMPKNAVKLSDCDILKIETWINNGALNN